MRNRRKFNVSLSALISVVLLIGLLTTPVLRPTRAQNSYQATLAIRLDQPRWTINRNLYGQFAEHLGRLIYEGIWVGENSPIPNTRGMRTDVLAALKELHVPVLLSSRNHSAATSLKVRS